MANKNTEYQLAIKIAGAVAASFNTTMGTVSKALSGLGSAAATAGKVAAVAAGAAATAMGAFAKSAVDVGMEFDKSMSQVAATMGTTVDQIGDLRQLAMDMGAKTAFSATQAAEALNYMALAGYDAETSTKMLPNVLNLAAAGGMELATASDMITDSQSALGLTIEQTSALVDQMAAASSKSNTSVAQLGEAILTVGGTAQYMAGGTEELATVLGVLADNGIKGSEGGTHLRNMLLSLSSPTADAQKTLDALGVSVFDAEGNMRSFSAIFPELNAAMSTMTDQEKLDAFSTIFNSRDIASATALLGTTTERWDELGDAILNSQGAAEAMANTQLDNLAGDITLWKSALEGAQIVLSDQLTPSLREFVQFGTDGLSRVTDAFKEGGLAGAMDAFGGVLSDGLDMIVGYLPTVMDAGMQLLGALGQGLLDNLPTLTAAAVEIVIMLAEGIAQAAPALVTGGIEAIGYLAAGIAEALPDLIPMMAGAIADILWAISDGLANFDIAPLVDGLTEGFSRAPDGMLEAATSLILNLGNGIAQAAPVLIQTVVDLGLSLLDALTSPELLTGLIGAALTIILGLADGLLQAIPSLVAAIPTIIQNLITAILGAIPLIINAGVDLLLALVDNLPAIINGIVAAIPQIITGIVSALTTSLPAIIDAGVQLLVALVQNLPAIITGIIAAIPQIITGITGTLSTCIPQIIEAGVYLLVALVQNMPAILAGIVAAIPQIISAILGALASLPGALGNLFLGAWEGIKAVFAGVGTFFQGVWDTIVSLFTSIGTAVGDAISGAVKGAINAVLSGAIGIINGFISAINLAISAINLIPGVNIEKLNKLEVPQLAEGGVVTAPTLLEAGEAGNEAIIPLGELWEQMQGFVDDALAAPSNWIADALSALGNGDEGNPDPDGNLPPIYITYSPVYHFEGEAPTKEDLLEAEKLSQEEFNRMAAQWLKEARRTNFRG